jgi:ribonuclease HI
MLRIFCDGASRMKDGERRGFIGIVAYWDGKLVAEHAAGVGIATSYEAGYYAIIRALSIGERY